MIVYELEAPNLYDSLEVIDTNIGARHDVTVPSLFQGVCATIFLRDCGINRLASAR